ncbi:MAG: lytic transglycosylase domain-containing protein [Deltaproteobacteria bacterium]|nr:lytic transglycosylase domain-containing protein [Deltaproteobacteria bacterium]
MFRKVQLAILSFCLLPSALYALCFEEAGKAYNINPALLEGIAEVESNLNPGALNINANGSVDIGLMQINSYWIKALGLKYNELVSDPCYNAMTGAKILRRCIDAYGYTWEAVGCYNANSMKKKIAYSWKVFNRMRAEDKKAKSSPQRKGKEQKATDTEGRSSLFFRVRDQKAKSYEYVSGRNSFETGTGEQ